MQNGVSEQKMKSGPSRIDYERKFFDQRALEVIQRNEDLSVRTDYDQALKFLKTEPQDLIGKRVLDCGCGSGELSTWLAMKGAKVFAVDLSQKSLEILKRRAELCNVSRNIEPKVMAIENLGYKENSFDFVIGEWILHHSVIDQSIPELYRVLKSGGKGFFLETSGNNKILLLCRRFLAGRFGIPKYQDEIEHPLTYADIGKIHDIFRGNCKCHYFPYMFFKLFDGYVFRHKIKFVTVITDQLDKLIYNYLPFLRKYSYYQIVEISKD